MRTLFFTDLLAFTKGQWLIYVHFDFAKTTLSLHALWQFKQSTRLFRESVKNVDFLGDISPIRVGSPRPPLPLQIKSRFCSECPENSFLLKPLSVLSPLCIFLVQVPKNIFEKKLLSPIEVQRRVGGGGQSLVDMSPKKSIFFYWCPPLLPSLHPKPD